MNGALRPGEDPRYSGGMERLIYILVRGADWRAAAESGRYHGSADDRRDGFLHASTAAQLRGSAAKHRAGESDLWMVTVDAAALGDLLRWEPAAGSSRPGLFPHIYGALPLAAVLSAQALPLDPGGQHRFPDSIP